MTDGAKASAPNARKKKALDGTGSPFAPVFRSSMLSCHSRGMF